MTSEAPPSFQSFLLAQYDKQCPGNFEAADDEKRLGAAVNAVLIDPAFFPNVQSRIYCDVLPSYTEAVRACSKRGESNASEGVAAAAMGKMRSQLETLFREASHVAQLADKSAAQNQVK